VTKFSLSLSLVIDSRNGPARRSPKIQASNRDVRDKLACTLIVCLCSIHEDIQPKATELKILMLEANVKVPLHAPALVFRLKGGIFSPEKPFSIAR
jgi:hypothetical protein